VPYAQQRQHQSHIQFDKPKPELQNIVSTASLGT
jgi:transcription initiation factor TFIID TATA-box-binding protein